MKIHAPILSRKSSAAQFPQQVTHLTHSRPTFSYINNGQSKIIDCARLNRPRKLIEEKSVVSNAYCLAEKDKFGGSGMGPHLAQYGAKPPTSP